MGRRDIYLPSGAAGWVEDSRGYVAAHELKMEAAELGKGIRRLEGKRDRWLDQNPDNTPPLADDWIGKRTRRPGEWTAADAEELRKLQARMAECQREALALE